MVTYGNMKKVKNLKIYKIYHSPSGNEFYVNFKPTKCDLEKIYNKNEWDAPEPEDGITFFDYCEITKLDIYQK